MRWKNEEEHCGEGADIRRLFVDLTRGCRTGKEFDEKLEQLKKRIDEMLEKQKGEKI